MVRASADAVLARESFDFVVIGSGVAGAGVAAYLAGQASVLMLEAETAAGVHATGRSVALFDGGYGPAGSRTLSTASRGFFDAPPVGFGAAPLKATRGALHIAREDQRAELEAQRRASPPGARCIDAEEACARAPGLRRDYVAAAILDETAVSLDVDALLQGFLRQARAGGVRLLMAEPLLGAEREGGAWRVRTPQREVTAGIVVNAAGAWADEVAVRCGAPPLGLSPRRRTVAVVDPPTDLDIARWPAVLDVGEAFYVKPEVGRLLVSPCDETPCPPGDAQPEEFDIAVAIDRMQAAIHIPVRRVRAAWAGLRTFLPDREMALGCDPAAPGLFWLAGQGGYGIQTAPAASRLAAALLLGDVLPPDLRDAGVDVAAFLPRRPATGEWV